MKVTHHKMLILVIVTGAILLPSSAFQNLRKAQETPGPYEDAYLTVVELITKYGYPAKEYTVTTSDGYILKLHRIPHGKNSDSISDKVVFLQHGTFCSSADWIITGPTHGLGYMLADQGYDVWMGNARGNCESRRHVTLNPDKDAEFWQFSWHEIGVIDVPTMIDYVLKKTGQSSLYYIGHSQGTTTFYVMTSMRPEYNAKVKFQISLAPIGYVKDKVSTLPRILMTWPNAIYFIAKLIGLNELFPRSNFTTWIGRHFCKDGDITQFLCTNTFFAIYGYSPKEMNATNLPVVLGHFPAGSSTKQIIHYLQEISSGDFCQYDYGSNNVKKYGSPKPPSYNLSFVTTPGYLFYSHGDRMATEGHVLRLCKELGDACTDMILVDNQFNHMDYLYGIRAPKVVYNKLINVLANN